MNDTEKANLLHLYRMGKLVPVDPTISAHGLTDEEVVIADANGSLVAVDEYVTVDGKCSKCPWANHVHVEDNLAMREEAEIELFTDHLHVTDGKCSGVLSFETHSGY